MAPEARAAAAAATGCAVIGVVGVVAGVPTFSSRMSLMDEPKEDGRDT